MQAAFERGNLLANHGEIEAAVAAFTEAHRLAERGNDLFGMAFAGNNLAYHTLLAGKADLAQQQIEAAITLTEQYKLTLLSQYVYSTAGEIALARQDLARAEEAFDQAYTAAQSRDNRIQMANVRASQALVAQARHKPAEAHALVEEAWSLFGETATDYHVRQRLERISKDISE
jgi:tetratricopeptide (TPR) repeat protein